MKNCWDVMSKSETCSHLDRWSTSALLQVYNEAVPQSVLDHPTAVDRICGLVQTPKWLANRTHKLYDGLSDLYACD
jgi:hypothetical protein